LQVGFQVMTGYAIGEYIRKRRLYLAALDLKQGKKIINVALSYGYETQEAFSKAFKRFHGFNPSEINNNEHHLRIFHPLNIDINVKGGEEMSLKYQVVDFFPLQLIGFVKEFDMEDSFEKIPLFWDEICNKYCYPRIYKGLPPANEYEQAIANYCIGEYGVCIDCHGSKFKYMIAGKYTGGKVPEGMMLYTFKAGKWAIFDCFGPCPEKLQELTTRIFKEFLPFNHDFELRDEGNIEWYDCINGNMTDSNYHTQIWLPIKEYKK